MRIALLLLVATEASAALLRPRSTPSFHTLSIQDAREGKDLDGKDFSTPASVTDNLANAATLDTPESRACRANPRIRREWRNYSHDDRMALMRAIKCLMGRPSAGGFAPSKNRYEDYVRLHQRFAGNIHENSKFHIWHRYMLWTFEQDLRRSCGFNRDFPWWDETKDAGNFANSGLFTTDYFGRLLPPQPNGQGWCINSGAFGGITLNIGPGNANTPHCLTRSLDETSTAECNAEYVEVCSQRATYAEFDSCMYGGPHAYGHNGIGAVMADVLSSASDPIFYMHHCFIDRVFRVWQNRDPARTTTINGFDAQSNALTMDTGIYLGGLGPDVRVRDILDTLSGTVINGVPFCYRYDY